MFRFFHGGMHIKRDVGDDVLTTLWFADTQASKCVLHLVGGDITTACYTAAQQAHRLTDSAVTVQRCRTIPAETVSHLVMEYYITA